jgi:hypothetical protein
MSVVDIEILAATTDQATSDDFLSPGPSTICASGIFGDDEGAKIQFTHNGSVWQDHYLNGVLQEIDSKHTMITVLGPGKFRVIKSATVGAIGIVRWWSEADG